MQLFSFCIDDTRDKPSPPSGFVVAKSLAEALAIVDHPEANVYPLAHDQHEWQRIPGLSPPGIERNRHGVLLDKGWPVV
jgi:hypothetical protein